MEIGKYIENINKIEEHINVSINLLEIAKTYCDYNYDKAEEISTLRALIEIILKEQQILAKNVDTVYLSNKT